jgi:hypothetical protein
LPFLAPKEATMPDLVLPVAVDDVDRDYFRSAVATLPPGPLRDVLTAVAYARDATARTGAVPDDRWRAVVAVAERAVRNAGTEFTPRLAAAA